MLAELRASGAAEGPGRQTHVGGDYAFLYEACFSLAEEFLTYCRFNGRYCSKGKFLDFLVENVKEIKKLSLQWHCLNSILCPPIKDCDVECNDWTTKGGSSGILEPRRAVYVPSQVTQLWYVLSGNRRYSLNMLHGI